MIEVTKYSELTIQKREQLDIFIQNEFGHIPIVREISWATPDWTIINYCKNKIATFYNIVEGTTTIDGRDFKVAGINNVITPTEFRGKGFSTETLIETKSFLFENLNADLALLLCADKLIPFYQRIGWYEVNCDVHFDQPTGNKIWTAKTMILTKAEKISPTKIELNGLPW